MSWANCSALSHRELPLVYHLVTRSEANVEAFVSVRPTKEQPINRTVDLKMPNPPIDPQADGANEPDPMDTDMMGFTSFDELDSAILDGFDPANINQMFAEFTDSLNAEIANAIASANIQMPPQATHLVSSQQGLEAYLVQMQIYAGIPLDQLQPMQASPQSQGGRRAPVIQIVNGRTMLAAIPPATFNGFLAPMLAHQIGPWNSENVEGGPVRFIFLSMRN